MIITSFSQNFCSVRTHVEENFNSLISEKLNSLDTLITEHNKVYLTYLDIYNAQTKTFVDELSVLLEMRKNCYNITSQELDTNKRALNQVIEYHSREAYGASFNKLTAITKLLGKLEEQLNSASVLDPLTASDVLASDPIETTADSVMLSSQPSRSTLSDDGMD